MFPHANMMCAASILGFGGSLDPTGASTTATFTNGNKTANDNVPATHAGARSVGAAIAGKWYFEVTVLNPNATRVGICGPLSLMSGQWVTDGNGSMTVGIDDGVIYSGNTSTGTTLGLALTLVGIAVDLDAKLFWARAGASGNWNANGSANPATGTLGKALSPTSAPWFAACDLLSGGTQSAAFAFGPSFSGAVPSGFITQ